MTTSFDATLNGRDRRVEVTAGESGRRFEVRVDGRELSFDAAWLDGETISLIAAGGSQADVHEVGIRVVQTPGDESELDVEIGGRTFRLSILVEGAGALRSEHSAEALDGRQSVRAPMPGRVVRVLVQPGDHVTAGQGVVVVEAMKMENEMRSPKDGVVREVRAGVGMAIDAGAVLVVVE